MAAGKLGLGRKWPERGGKYHKELITKRGWENSIPWNSPRSVRIFGLETVFLSTICHTLSVIVGWIKADSCSILLLNLSIFEIKRKCSAITFCNNLNLQPFFLSCEKRQRRPSGKLEKIGSLSLQMFSFFVTRSMIYRSNQVQCLTLYYRELEIKLVKLFWSRDKRRNWFEEIRSIVIAY